ncbi:MAG: phosphotransferase family protein, partial [Anaerolineae bacterium]
EKVERCLARLADDLDSAGRELILTLPGRMDAVRAELATHPAAVTHRDFHLDNVLFEPTGRPVILDWALAGWGAVAADVGRVLVECIGTRDLPGGYAAAHDSVLDAYRGEVRRLGAGPCPRPELARGVGLALHVTLAGAVTWAGAAKRPAPGSREVALARNLVLNCVAALLA